MNVVLNAAYGKNLNLSFQGHAGYELPLSLFDLRSDQVLAVFRAEDHMDAVGDE